MRDFATYLKKTKEVGYVEEVAHAIVHASGLPGAVPKEVVVFESGEFGEIVSLSNDSVEIITFSKRPVRVGTRVTRTNESLAVGVGEELLGSVIDPLGNSLDQSKPVKKPKEHRIIDVVPSGIQTRKRIKRPCDTSVALVDLVVPIGKGQRELVIGDRKTGKTTFLLQTVRSQAKSGSICIYAAIGKKKLDVKKVEEYFVKNGIAKQTIIVASTSHDPAGLIFLTPYSAMTIAEYFRDQGKDVLIVLDDLSTHAKFYREIALLGRRFPGRNSYPGDIFHTHARLLERAGNFLGMKGESAITCIPVAETTQGDLSGYIQTNLMAMTDGHIYFDSDFFAKGRRPSINPFLSVTRVGRQTQSPLRREINRELISFLTLYEKMQLFIHFGAELSETIRKTLTTGEKIIVFFDQPARDAAAPTLQIFLFSLMWIGAWQTKTIGDMRADMKKLTEAYQKDKKFKISVDAMVEKAASFNAMLGELRSQQETLLGRILSGK